MDVSTGSVRNSRGQTSLRVIKVWKFRRAMIAHNMKLEKMQNRIVFLSTYCFANTSPNPLHKIIPHDQILAFLLESLVGRAKNFG